MQKLIEFDSAGGRIVVETGGTLDGAIRGAGIAGVTEKAGKSFDDSISIISPIAESALAKISGLASIPETVEIEFGLKFTANVGAILAATGAEGTLKIKLVWKPSK